MTIEQIYSQTDALSQIEKALLVDKILSSLHKTDKNIDNLWAVEVENRLDNYSKYQQSKDMDEVIAKYK